MPKLNSNHWIKQFSSKHRDIKANLLTAVRQILYSLNLVSFFFLLNSCNQANSYLQNAKHIQKAKMPCYVRVLERICFTNYGLCVLKVL